LYQAPCTKCHSSTEALTWESERYLLCVALTFTHGLLTGRANLNSSSCVIAGSGGTCWLLLVWSHGCLSVWKHHVKMVMITDISYSLIKYLAENSFKTSVIFLISTQCYTQVTEEERALPRNWNCCFHSPALRSPLLVGTAISSLVPPQTCPPRKKHGNNHMNHGTISCYNQSYLVPTNCWETPGLYAQKISANFSALCPRQLHHLELSLSLVTSDTPLWAASYSDHSLEL
jgi:hypothetical protein